MDTLSAEYELNFHQDSSHTLQVRLAGKWKIGNGLPNRERVLDELEKDPGIREIRFDTNDVTQWDSGLLVFLVEVNRIAEKRDIKVCKEVFRREFGAFSSLRQRYPNRPMPENRENLPFGLPRSEFVLRSWAAIPLNFLNL
jgi:hypothetical protein